MWEKLREAQVRHSKDLPPGRTLAMENVTFQAEPSLFVETEDKNTPFHGPGNHLGVDAKQCPAAGGRLLCRPARPLLSLGFPLLLTSLFFQQKRMWSLRT